jgi:translocator protein
MTDRLRQIAVAVTTVATLAINGWIASTGLNGNTIGGLSRKYDALIQPADWAFSIWSLIYAGLIAYSVYQFLPRQKENPHLRKIGWLYILTGVANTGWLFAWFAEQIELSLVLMLVLLGSLLAIYLQLRSGGSGNEVTLGEKLAVRLAFSFYIGWITVATIVNASVLLIRWNWNAFGISPETWTIIMLIIALVIGIASSLRYTDPAYIAVLTWAFVGVAVANADRQNVALVAWVVAGIAGLLVLVNLIRLGMSNFRPPTQRRPRNELSGTFR